MVDKKTVLHNAGNLIDGAFHGGRINRRGKVYVEYQIAVLGDNRAGFAERFPQGYCRAQCLKRHAGAGPCFGDNFHRNRKTYAKAVGDFCFVDRYG
jgi:hypothetical protein